MGKDKNQNQNKRARKEIQENDLNESIVISELRDRLVQVEGNVYDLQEENLKLKKHIDKIEKDNTSLQAAVHRERARVDLVSKNINNIEQYTRANNIRIFGLDDRDIQESNTQTEAKVKKLLGLKLGITLENRDIEACHRLGRFSPSANRPVICRFTNRKLKVAALTNRRKLKGTQIVLTEDLTQFNHNKLKEMKTLECVDQAWVRDGKLIIKSQNNVIKTIPWDTPCQENLFELVKPISVTQHEINKLAIQDQRESSDTGRDSGSGGQRGLKRGGPSGGGDTGASGRQDPGNLGTDGRISGDGPSHDENLLDPASANAQADMRGDPFRVNFDNVSQHPKSSTPNSKLKQQTLDFTYSKS